MRYRRRKVHLSAQGATMLLKVVALLAMSWWGLRTIPEIVRYVRMERM